MSRGFVKEGDQEDVPLVTPRAYLPAGVENFVTPEGLQALKDEREELLAERKKYEGVDNNDARVNKLSYRKVKTVRRAHTHCASHHFRQAKTEGSRLRCNNQS